MGNLFARCMKWVWRGFAFFHGHALIVLAKIVVSKVSATASKVWNFLDFLHDPGKMIAEEMTQTEAVGRKDGVAGPQPTSTALPNPGEHVTTSAVRREQASIAEQGHAAVGLPNGIAQDADPTQVHAGLRSALYFRDPASDKSDPIAPSTTTYPAVSPSLSTEIDEDGQRSIDGMSM
ncbi:hypothetical protein ABUW04_12395 [Streptacidiphilus sp. N1-10]|uniref:Uncharacterized protein n=1 Tax=Streptacidiphilus jeojiensis TaxID=3229225 RepID=A0ABV6XLX4_9ACTN